jgi:hypothetical protein
MMTKREADFIEQIVGSMTENEYARAEKARNDLAAALTSGADVAHHGIEMLRLDLLLRHLHLRATPRSNPA